MWPHTKLPGKGSLFPDGATLRLALHPGGLAIVCIVIVGYTLCKVIDEREKFTLSLVSIALLYLIIFVAVLIAKLGF